MLEGVRVVEMGMWVAGPAVGGVLADWGADVIKVEPPQGDPMRDAFRKIGGFEFATNPPYALDNRGKRCIVIDGHQASGRALVQRLARGADIFLTNYRMDALRRLGADPETLRALHPGLIYAHVSGYGLEGPDKDRPGYDIGSYWARSGIAHLLTIAGRDPTPSRGGFGDHVTAITCVAGILAALHHREKTGEGQLVEASLLRAAIYTIGWDLGMQSELGFAAPAMGREVAGLPTTLPYRCADDKWVWLLGVEAERHWPFLLKALGLEDLQNDERFKSTRDRRKNGRELLQILDAEFAKKPRDEWTRIFDDVGLWWAPVQTALEVLNDPQALASGAFRDVPKPDGEGTLRVVNSPIKFSAHDPLPPARPAALGQDTDQVLGELGLSAAEITKLREQQVIT